MRSCRQGVLTARLGVRERILKLLEGGVGGDSVGHVLCALWLELVAHEAANEGHSQALGGIGSKAGVQSAYSSSVRVVLVAMASATCFAPSGPSRFM